MKTADFLGTAPFMAHLQRRRTPRRLLTLCAFSLLCLTGTSLFGISVRAEEERAEKAAKPVPEAEQARQDLARIFEEMNVIAQHLDPLTDHLAMPGCAHLVSGLEEALGQSVEIERILWKKSQEVKKRGKKKKVGPETVRLEVEAIALDEETATSLDELLAAYTGYTAKVESHEPVEDRWPATRMRISLQQKPEGGDNSKASDKEKEDKS